MNGTTLVADLLKSWLSSRGCPLGRLELLQPSAVFLLACSEMRQAGTQKL
jgi:hypothetical protein